MNELNHFKFSPSTWIIPTFMLVAIWLIFYFEHSFNIDLGVHGIYPRTLSGLQGVLFSPFLHADLSHIANNSLPLFILSTALIYFYRELSLKVLVYGILLSGIITWIIGRESYHIGASSLIYVLVSFIFFKGTMTKYYRLMALSMAVIVLYGGMIWYVFPEVDKTISWEGHLAGLITGFVFAVRFKTPDYVKDIQFEWEKPDFNPELDPFMKHFDENGNFVNTPQPEEEVLDEILPLATPAIQYNYIFKENKNVSED
ncbi:rhomboid family intramembrane serine protease [Flavobacterium sp. SUN046]|uniref:rhomboid family intramembrane serine protease n=1 Tax=Flavobacterium sp. SUN046 TaxID=3002440 RepID=UPI002DB5737F|nr:rhomboid family intramembrane serine protease [Flavobacterium sp. SUN046]MEC4049713.1 rhomboid family intramembrane serine protease [Flavobacterium sp. SUN046]